MCFWLAGRSPVPRGIAAPRPGSRKKVFWSARILTARTPGLCVRVTSPDSRVHATGQPAAPVWQLQCRYRGMNAYGGLNAHLSRLALCAPRNLSEKVAFHSDGARQAFGNGRRMRLPLLHQGHVFACHLSKNAAQQQILLLISLHLSHQQHAGLEQSTRRLQLEGMVTFDSLFLFEPKTHLRP